MLVPLSKHARTKLQRTAGLPIAAALLLSSACSADLDAAEARDAVLLSSNLVLADAGPVVEDRTSCEITRPAVSTESTGGGADFIPRRGMIVPAYMPVDGVRRESSAGGHARRAQITPALGRPHAAMVASFNPCAAQNVMRRNTISMGETWVARRALTKRVRSNT